MKNTHLFNFNTLVLVMSMLSLGVLSLHLGQDANWDLRNYHYYNVYALLNGRIGFDYAPAHVQTYLNPLLDFPFYFLLTHLTPKWVGFIMGAIHGINFWLVYLISNQVLRFLSNIKKVCLSLACAAAGIYGAGFISEVGTVFNDSMLSIFLLGSILLTIRWLYQDENSASTLKQLPILLASVLLGIAVGLKLYAAVFGIGMIVALIFSVRTWRARILTTVLWSIGAFAGLVISSGYWMFLMWNKFQSPLFPFYNKIFKSPYFEYKNLADHRFLPKDLTQTLFYPFYFATTQRHVSEVFFRDIRYAVLYIMVVLLISKIIYQLIHKREFNLKSGSMPSDTIISLRFLLPFCVTSYVVWQSMFSIYRYMITLELLVPLLIVLIIFYSFKKGPLRALITASVLIAIIAFAKIPSWGRASWKDDFFGVKIPMVEQADYKDNPAVLLSGNHPLAYILPFFPPNFRFIQVKGNFNGPRRKTKLESEIRALLTKQKAPIYLLADFKDISSANEDMSAYGLYALERSCRHVISNLEKGIVLCSVRRVTG